jgi:hypothetical protein
LHGNSIPKIGCHYFSPGLIALPKNTLPIGLFKFLIIVLIKIWPSTNVYHIQQSFDCFHSEPPPQSAWKNLRVQGERLFKCHHLGQSLCSTCQEWLIFYWALWIESKFKGPNPFPHMVVPWSHVWWIINLFWGFHFDKRYIFPNIPYQIL